jgi:hypothetical protein
MFRLHMLEHLEARHPVYRCVAKITDGDLCNVSILEDLNGKLPGLRESVKCFIVDRSNIDTIILLNDESRGIKCGRKREFASTANVKDASGFKAVPLAKALNDVAPSKAMCDIVTM